MTEQRKAAAPGEHNTVTHEVADSPAPAVSDAVKRSRGKGVTLRTVHSYNVFQTGDLPPVTHAGTTYTANQADEVQTAAKKYGVRVVRVSADENEEN